MTRSPALVALAAAFIFALGLLAGPVVSHFSRISLARAMQATAPPMDSLGYQRKISQFAILPQTRHIVFLGDSRIEQGEWSELFGRCDISNRGVSGDTTVGVLQRLQTSLPTDGILCLLQVGINDLTEGASIENISRNYERIVDFLRDERHAKIVVTSIIFAAADRSELNARIAQCNRALKSIVEAKGARWLDLNATLCPDGFLPLRLTSDEAHLNGDGYSLMRNAIAPLLEMAP